MSQGNGVCRLQKLLMQLSSGLLGTLFTLIS